MAFVDRVRTFKSYVTREQASTDGRHSRRRHDHEEPGPSQYTQTHRQSSTRRRPSSGRDTQSFEVDPPRETRQRRSSGTSARPSSGDGLKPRFAGYDQIIDDAASAVSSVIPSRLPGETQQELKTRRAQRDMPKNPNIMLEGAMLKQNRLPVMNAEQDDQREQIMAKTHAAPEPGRYMDSDKMLDEDYWDKLSHHERKGARKTCVGDLGDAYPLPQR